MALESTFLGPIDEEARQRFEAAWQKGCPEPVERFLPAEDHPLYLATLEELVHIELEFGWKRRSDPAEAGTTHVLPRVEDYLARFSRLNDPAIVRRLAQQEWHVRRRAGDAPSPEELRRRFPGLRESVGPAEETLARTPPVPQRPPDLPGYEILGELGRGGMGVVYKARQLALDRVVALKLILAGARASAEERARFRSEAEAVARLLHPNIVQIFETGEQDGTPYFSLEFVEGGNLAERLAGTPQPARETAALLEIVARAVHFAHERGIVHRDLKPANVLLQRDSESGARGEGRGAREDRRSEELDSLVPSPLAPRPSPLAPLPSPLLPSLSLLIPKITDFGLAKRLQGGGQTQTGAIVGTPSYMSPEQASGKGKEVGPAADVYALGAILYEMLTGRPPFKAETPLDTVLQVIADEPVPPRRLQPGVPRDLETLCLKCLRKEPRQRCASALELAEELRRFQAGEPIRARPAGLGERVAKWCRRRPAVAGLLVLVGVITLIGFGLVTWKWREAVELAQVAEQRRQQAVAAERTADTRLRTSEKNLYLQLIAAAEREWVTGDPVRARQLLRQCQPDLRRWEWGYLDGLFEGSLQSLTGHRQPISCLAFSGDGRRLASGSHDGTVKLWDADSGRLLFTLTGPPGGVTCLAFQRDGRRLASASFGGGVSVWDPDSGKHLRSLKGHAAVVVGVGFSPDGKRLASAARDNTLKVWDMATGRETAAHTLKGHSDFIYSVAFSPDGKRLASAGGDRIAILWDLQSGKAEHTLRGHTERLFCVGFSPDGKWLASGSSDKSVKVWEVARGTLRRSLAGHTQGVWGVAFSPDGRLASAGFDRTSRVWDPATGKEVLLYRGHAREIVAVAFRPDGRRVASGGFGKQIRLWDATSGQDERPLTLKGHRFTVQAVAFSPGTNQLATAGADQTVRLWDLTTGRTVRTIRCGDIADGVAFAPDGKSMAAVVGSEVRIWDAGTGKVRRSLPGQRCVAFHPEASHLLVAAKGKTLKLWDATTGKEVRTFTGHAGPVSCAAFGPGGMRLVTGSADKSVRIWDTETGALLVTLRGHGQPVRGVAYAPDGWRVASVAGDQSNPTLQPGEAKVWDVEAGKEVLALTGHVGPVNGVAFSPDGSRLATVAGQLFHPDTPGEVKLWDASTGQEVLALKGHTGPGWGVVFHRDGHSLATCSWDRTAKVWKGRPFR